jgi:hypothetical protein
MDILEAIQSIKETGENIAKAMLSPQGRDLVNERLLDQGFSHASQLMLDLEKILNAAADVGKEM